MGTLHGHKKGNSINVAFQNVMQNANLEMRVAVELADESQNTLSESMVKSYLTQAVSDYAAFLSSHPPIASYPPLAPSHREAWPFRYRVTNRKSGVRNAKVPAGLN